MGESASSRAAGIRNFLRTDVWRISTRALPPRKAFWIRQLRVLLLAVRGFAEDRCQLRASALTFYSLLSVVPILAMAFGVAKGFGFERHLERQLYDALPDKQEVVRWVIDFAQSFLQKAQGGVIAGVGVVLLLWTVIKVMGNIEDSFNAIWQVEKPRSLLRKFTDYLSLMFVAPILLVTSSSLTLIITKQVGVITSRIALLGALGPVISWLIAVLPYAFIWALFTFVYVMMPNTAVRMKAGVIGGVIAGTIYQVVQWVYISFQIGVATYGAIYGSFAALPLFLLWLQLSWMVVLFGAEVSYAAQNVDLYEYEAESLGVSHATKRRIALRTAHLCVKNFEASEPPWTAERFSQSLEAPVRLVRTILAELTEAGVLSEVRASENDEPAYQPARAIQTLTVKTVADLIDRRGVDHVPVAESSEMERIDEQLRRFDRVLEEADADVPLKDV